MGIVMLIIKILIFFSKTLFQKHFNLCCLVGNCYGATACLQFIMAGEKPKEVPILEFCSECCTVIVHNIGFLNYKIVELQ